MMLKEVIGYMLQKQRMYAIIITVVMLIMSSTSPLILSQLFADVIINSSGRILTRIQFDNCDQIDNWKVSSGNILEVDFIDRFEGLGSLKGIILSRWGVSFRKSGLWDFSHTPLMRVWMKINQSMPSAFRFELDDGPSIFYYEIINQLIVGKWVEVVIDLRLPSGVSYGDSRRTFPNLDKVNGIAFTTWTTITTPLTFNWDNMMLDVGPYILPQIELTPYTPVTVVNESISLVARVIGGEKPYSFTWYINRTLQQGKTSSTFDFSAPTAGVYNVTCQVTDALGNSTSASRLVRVLSTPSIQPIPYAPEVFKSEVRAVSVAYVWGPSHNQTLIAETLREWGINTAYTDIQANYLIDFTYGWDGTIDNNLPYHRLFINKCHEYGIRVIASLVTLACAPNELRAETSSGTIEWLDITKPAAKDMLKAVVQALASYGFDGINLDYIRWPDRTDIPLGESARIKFITDTGLVDVNWPTDIFVGGRYFYYFLRWRADLITELVRDIRNWAKEVNPNIAIMATPFCILPDATWYWVRQNGQDVAEWVEKGYIDYLSPMLYESDPQDCVMYLEASKDLWTGGSEGAVPIVPWIDYYRTNVTIFVQRIQAIKNARIDGWILTPYGGPGANLNYPDIRPYLAALHEAGLMEPIWIVQNFSITMNSEGTLITVSWSTTVPTKSKIEYSNRSLFEAKERYYYNLTYKDIEYVAGFTISDEEFKTLHIFTIAVTDQKVLRIISTDASNVTITSWQIPLSEIIF
ncbi:MAG: family 10 glycosylhydrolase [Candidatus Bathyarchaeia archaeon]